MICLRMLVKVRIIRKFASAINGVDLTKWNVGDVIELPRATAAMLILEGWAELIT